MSTTLSIKNVMAPGIQVTKAAQSLPQSATATLFSVSGHVLVTGMLGAVTGAVGNGAVTLALGNSITTTAIAAATDISNKSSGTWYMPQGSSGAGGTPLISSAIFLPGDASRFFSPFIMGNVGATVISWTTSSSQLGLMAWYLWYVPISSGATVS